MNIRTHSLCGCVTKKICRRVHMYTCISTHAPTPRYACVGVVFRMCVTGMTVAVKRRRGEWMAFIVPLPTESPRSTDVEVPVEGATAVTPRSGAVLERGSRPVCCSHTATPTATSTTHAATTPPAIAPCEALGGLPDEVTESPPLLVTGAATAAAATVPPGLYCAAATSTSAYAGTAARGPPGAAAGRVRSKKY